MSSVLFGSFHGFYRCTNSPPEDGPEALEEERDAQDVVELGPEAGPGGQAQAHPRNRRFAPKDLAQRIHHLGKVTPKNKFC